MSKEGLEPQYFHKALSDFWLEYDEKAWLNKYWESIAQVVDEEYLELYHANFSKSLLDCPVYIRKLWLNFTFNEADWTLNRRPHNHKSYSFTAVGGETDINLPFDVTDDASLVFKNGVLLQYSREYLLPLFNKITLNTPAVAGDIILVDFVDFVEEEDHSHKIWQEYLLFPKQDWTDDPGDVFSALGEYDPLSTYPIQFFVDGVLLDPSQYTMVSGAKITTAVSYPAGTQIKIRWANFDEDDIHTHIRYRTWYPAYSNTIEIEPTDLSNNERLDKRFRFNPSDDYVPNTKQDLVWIAGLLKAKDENNPIVNADYRVDEDNVILGSDSTAEIAVVVDVVDPGIRFFNTTLDDEVVRIPKLQDGIDLPENEWYEYEDFEIKNGAIYSNTKFTNVWAFESYINEQTPYYNFGEPIDFRRDNDDVYLGMVQGLWRAYWSGPRVHITEEACKMLLNVPFVVSESRISNITDSGAVKKKYNIEFENETIYELDYPLEPRFREGDLVPAFDTLADGVKIYDFVNNPNWYKLFPPFLEFFEDFYSGEDGNPYPSVFDDGWVFDDEGRFDHMDYRFLPDSFQEIYKERLFEVLKHFVFLVDLDINVIPEVQNLTDVTIFLDRIKPAYTTYVIIATKRIKDELQRPGELLEGDFELDINDIAPAPYEPFNDGFSSVQIINQGLATPPNNPVFGDQYIVSAGGIDEWAGHDEEIALWNADHWVFTVPTEGLGVFDLNEAKPYIYDGLDWVEMSGEPVNDPYFDDGGLFDIEFNPFESVATAGQVQIELPYRSYQDNWIVEINGVALTEGVDWSWADDTNRYILLASALAGGEAIVVYRENYESIPMDWRVAGDYVEFELTT